MNLKRKSLSLLLMLVIYIAGSSFQVAAEKNLNRIAGSDRYETAVEISKTGWPDGAETVVLARGDQFPDALTGTPLAYKEDGPILLTQPDKLHEATKREIERLKAKKVIILGGDIAVSQQVENKLKNEMGLKVERVAGNNRYDTAVKIAQLVGFESGSAFIANGQDFPDALTVAYQAAQQGNPILLVEKNKIPDEVKPLMEGLRSYTRISGEIDELKEFAKFEVERSDVEKAIILGEANAVTIQIEDALEDEMNIEVYRLDKNSSFVYDPDSIYFITVQDLLNMFEIAYFVSKQGNLVILVEDEKKWDELLPMIQGLTNVTVVGGEAVISAEVYNLLPENRERISGRNRFETNAKVVMNDSRDQISAAYVATGFNFADALTGSVLAAKENKPIMLVNRDRVPYPIVRVKVDKNISGFTALGGNNVVPDSLLQELKNASINDERKVEAPVEDLVGSGEDISDRYK